MPKPSDFSKAEYLKAAEGKQTLKEACESLGVNPNSAHDYLKRNGWVEPMQDKLSDGGERSRAHSGRREEKARTSPGGVDTSIQKLTRTPHKNGESLESSGTRIKTLEELLEAAEVDLEKWRVRDYRVNAWEQHSVEHGIVTHHQVRANLEPNVEAVELAELRGSVVEEMRAHSPGPVPKIRRSESTGLAMEIQIPDLHLGALSHAEETGSNYDGGLAVEAFRYVFSDFVNQARVMGVERFIFPVGSDLIHVDSAENETTRGTRQDVDSRVHRTRRRARELMVWAIDSLVQIAKTDVVIVEGNHGRESESMLGDVLQAWYRREPEVTIHDSPAPRKYLTHGTNLLGFTHGDGPPAKDLPIIMATEQAEDWAKTTFRAWSTGHKHQRGADKFGSTFEDKGVLVRISPSLKPEDSWHAFKGLIGNLKAGEAYVYDRDRGEVARFTASLPKEFYTREAA